MKTILITVEQADIDAGIRGRCRLCPVARAITRATGFDCAAGMFTIDLIDWETSHEPVTILAPDSVRDFIDRFDAGEKVSPIQFTLEISD